MSIRSRKTSSKTRSGRSNHALRDAAIVINKDSGNAHLRHTVDLKTGMYRGKNVLEKRTKTQTAEAKTDSSSKNLTKTSKK